MGDKYLDLLEKFKKRMKLIEDFNPNYYFLHDCCVDFFNKIESLSSRESIYFIEKFNFNSLYKFNASGEVYLVEKNYFILSEMITLAIDKYGVDAVVKYLLPERIEHAKSSLFYNLLNLFLSLFRKTKIYIKNGYDSSAALAEAVNDLRDLKDKKALPFLDRGEAFVQALSTLCLLTFNKYATPIKKSNYFEDNLKKAVTNKLAIENNLNVGKKWWDDVKSKSISTPSSVYSDPSNHIYEEIDSYLEGESDDGWSESEWDDGESQYYEHTFVTEEPIYENLPAQTLVGTNETPLLSSPIEQSTATSLPQGKKPALPFKKSGLATLSRHSDLRIVDKSSKSPSDTDSGHQSDSENESDKQTSESESKALAEDSVYLQSLTFFKLPLPTSVQNNSEPFSAAINNTGT